MAFHARNLRADRADRSRRRPLNDQKEHALTTVAEERAWHADRKVRTPAPMSLITHREMQVTAAFGGENILNNERLFRRCSVATHVRFPPLLRAWNIQTNNHPHHARRFSPDTSELKRRNWSGHNHIPTTIKKLKTIDLSRAPRFLSLNVFFSKSSGKENCSQVPLHSILRILRGCLILAKPLPYWGLAALFNMVTEERLRH